MAREEEGEPLPGRVPKTTWALGNHGDSQDYQLGSPAMLPASPREHPGAPPSSLGAGAAAVPGLSLTLQGEGANPAPFWASVSSYTQTGVCLEKRSCA